MKQGKSVSKPIEAKARVMLDLPDDLVTALDRLIAKSEIKTTRSEALEAAFRDWALQHGFLHPEDASGCGMRPEELNAANDG